MGQNDPQPQTVLLIDDDVISRELLALLFEAAGFAVSAFETGSLALEYLRGQRGHASPAIFLVDLQMPGIAGVELAGALRAACPGSALLLGMSASKPGREVAAAYDGFLLKPFGVRQFLAKVIQMRASSHTIPAVAAAGIGADGGGDFSDDVILNLATHAKLSASMPAQELKKLYALCLSDSRERVREMRYLAAAGDQTGFRKQAHAIRGGCSMLGAIEIARIAGDLEELASESWNAQSAADEADKLMLACDRLECIL